MLWLWSFWATSSCLLMCHPNQNLLTPHMRITRLLLGRTKQTLLPLSSTPFSPISLLHAACFYTAVLLSTAMELIQFHYILHHSVVPKHNCSVLNMCIVVSHTKLWQGRSKTNQKRTATPSLYYLSVNKQSNHKELCWMSPICGCLRVCITKWQQQWQMKTHTIMIQPYLFQSKKKKKA